MSIFFNEYDLKNVYSQVTVGTSAVPLIEQSLERLGCVFVNLGTAIIYLGDSKSVSTSIGLPLLPRQTVVYCRYWGDETRLPIFAISGTAGQDVRVMETLEVK
jgi:hypothetical protein